MLITLRSQKANKINRLHVADHLFSNSSQMTSKCGEEKRVAHMV